MDARHHGDRDVSVVVPARNAAATLRATLESLLLQKGASLEVIVVDDGSTDATAAVAEGLGDDRVRVIRGDARGAAAARNRGAHEANGRFLAFVDADDVVEPTWLEELFAPARGGAKVVTCGLRVIDAGKPDRIELPEPQADLGGAAAMFMAGTFLVDRAIFVAAGGYDARLTYSENTELSWRLIRELKRQMRIDEGLSGVHLPLYRYYVSSGSGRSIAYEERKFVSLGLILEKTDLTAEFRVASSRFCSIYGVMAARRGKSRLAAKAFSQSLAFRPGLRSLGRLAVVLVPGASRVVWGRNA